jgi:hypothetical protein
LKFVKDAPYDRVAINALLEFGLRHFGDTAVAGQCRCARIEIGTPFLHLIRKRRSDTMDCGAGGLRVFGAVSGAGIRRID